VLWNGGVAVGGRGAFKAGFYTGNVFLFLVLYFVMFLPANLAAIRRRAPRFARPLFWSFWPRLRLVPDHVPRGSPVQQVRGLPPQRDAERRGLQRLLEDGLLPLAAGGLAALYVTRLRRPSLYLVYPLALATLLPLRLIEHRYGLPAFVMLLVCREDDPPAVEYAGVALGALLSGAAVYVLARGLWLL
jgi:hypothetical protein